MKKMKKLNKKAVVEVQFNWIFVMIAGAVILAFFAFVAVKMRGTSESKADVLVANMLESVLMGTKVSAGAETRITLPKKDVKFDCRGYTIRGKHTSLSKLSLFSPGLIKGKEIVFKTHGWKVPFRVTNFMYITSPQVRYIFVFNDIDDGSAAKGIYDDMPGGVKKEIYYDDDGFKSESIDGWDVSLVDNEWKDKNNYKIKFIVFDNGGFDINRITDPHLSDIKKTKSYDITAIVVNKGEAGDYTKGEISFFVSKPDKGGFDGDISGGDNKVNYYKNATLFGAIFAKDKEMYECVMEKEFEKLNNVAEVLEKRSEKLIAEKYTDPNSECYKAHSAAESALSTLSDLQYNPNWLSTFIGTGNPISTLIIKNNDAQKRSCALIY